MQQTAKSQLPQGFRGELSFPKMSTEKISQTECTAKPFCRRVFALARFDFESGRGSLKAVKEGSQSATHDTRADGAPCPAPQDGPYRPVCGTPGRDLTGGTGGACCHAYGMEALKNVTHVMNVSQ